MRLLFSLGGFFLQVFSKSDKENENPQVGSMLNQSSPPSFDSSSIVDKKKKKKKRKKLSILIFTSN